jgi:hypothetical protein
MDAVMAKVILVGLSQRKTNTPRRSEAMYAKMSGPSRPSQLFIDPPKLQVGSEFRCLNEVERIFPPIPFPVK